MSDDKKTPDVLKEIKFDNFETTTDTITITADVQLGDTNTVTVNVPLVDRIGILMISGEYIMP